MIIPAGYAHVLMGFIGVGAPTGAAITFGLENAGLQTPAALAVAIDAQLVANNVRQSWSASVTCNEIKVKLGPNQTGPAAAKGTNLVGTLGTSGHPGAAFLVQKNTLAGGRRGRGRFFIPGVAEADCDPAGVLLAANVIQVESVWNAFRVDMEGLGLPLVLLHSDNGTPSEIVSFTASSQVATQRRRNRR